MNDSNSDFPNDTGAQPMALLTPEERYNRIAEAAYLRAAARGFAGGDAMQDWLDAEADLMNSVEDERNGLDLFAERHLRQDRRRSPGHSEGAGSEEELAYSAASMQQSATSPIGPATAHERLYQFTA